ncbi:DUF3093 family protein [Amycolatopsis acidiphila]|uniref:DUF3093 domain-containing protein n=1 Tax=Amycolatopsis acidiphila TaxID=715473 RepID=A0A558A012_9PSEU|nr:DUF3093 family protein [Amycolatopsis acidiphila]TVT17581.1 hypothetical protein FNH06_30880 [Amycolatopsis acidiphila]UIJ60513.1 DUF3093 family protein [Amycolatopsis acidiphila]GHG82417.1 hypothetical protein GCM10017788_52960 [Amycolatopsis acidiphila]
MSETRYLESGAKWTALLYGPFFAVFGYLAELATGATHAVAWVLVGLGLAAITAPWVYARRRFLTVRVTGTELWEGRESLPLAEIAETQDVGAPTGARVLGGGWSTPRKYDELPIRLKDGTVVLAWAKDVHALRAAIEGA